MSNRITRLLESKNGQYKKEIIRLCLGADYSIAELTKILGTSIPTTTKILGEMIEEGVMEDLGKLGTTGGRKPSIFGLRSDAGYFVGVDVHKDIVCVAITDFKGGVVDIHVDIPFELDKTEAKYKELCEMVQRKVAQAGFNYSDILAYGFNFTGRVNHKTGYSLSYSIDEQTRVDDILSSYLDCPVFIENDSRAMTYGEYTNGIIEDEKDVLFVNASWGLGMGIILGGKLFYGKSGFSGEIGHFPLMGDDKICQCGKTGCLETGASGYALHELVMEKLGSGRPSILKDRFRKGEYISLEAIMDAILSEDVLCIEAIGEIGTTLGRAIAGLINIFNPETVVIGGILSEAREYIMLPVRASVNKHALKIVSKDTTVKFSKLGKRGGAIGACTLSRSRLLGLV